jgi:hypothetical protein
MLDDACNDISKTIMENDAGNDVTKIIIVADVSNDVIHAIMEADVSNDVTKHSLCAIRMNLLVHSKHRKIEINPDLELSLSLKNF